MTTVSAQIAPFKRVCFENQYYDSTQYKCIECGENAIQNRKDGGKFVWYFLKLANNLVIYVLSIGFSCICPPGFVKDTSDGEFLIKCTKCPQVSFSRTFSIFKTLNFLVSDTL